MGRKNKRAYGTGRIYQPAGCRFWYVQYWVGGRQIRESSRSAVKQVAEQMLRDRLVGRDNNAPLPQDMKKTTYGDLRRMLLDHYSTQRKKSLQVLADGTETIWGLGALDKFFGWKSEENPGAWRAVAIDNGATQRFIRERRAEGVSDATIRGSLALLVQMLNLAKRQRKIPEVPHIEKPKAPDGREDFVREPELERILAELPRLRPFLVFLFYQGTRSGEAAAIRWRQMDVENALYFPEETKTGEREARPLHDRVVSELRALGRGGPDDTVFDSANAYRAFRNVGAKILERPMTLHGLRRSCVVYYRERGVPDGVIRKITGHRTLAVFIRHYDAADMQAMRAAMEKAAAASPMLTA